MRDIRRIRNIGIIAHIDAGKTTVTERFLYYSGKEHRIGEVDEGTATMDWMAEERERGITITAAATTFTWQHHVVNLIDTPGHVDFTAEVQRSLRVLDGAVGVFSGVEGVEAQSETVWHQAEARGVPRLVFVNKLDRVGADFFRVVEEVRERLGAKAVPLEIPWGRERALRGVVDLLEERLLTFDPATQGARVTAAPIPAALRAEAARRREELVEAVAEEDEELAELYLGEGEVTPAALRAALRRATLAGRVFPTFCGAALHNVGLQPLLDGIVAYLPSPLDVPPARGTLPDRPQRTVTRPCDPGAPFAALAFKTAATRHGDLTYLRVYSGTARPGQQVRNTTRGKAERFGRIYRMHANEREPLDRMQAGDIVAVTGLRHTVTGDTLADRAHPILFEPIRFPETVVSVAVEPRSTADRERLLEALDALAREDPTFEKRYDEETGQLLIAGMGELHIEVLVQRVLREFRVAARVGKPRVAYRQSIRRPCEVEGRVERQAGGRAFFAAVRLRLEPDPTSPRVAFVDALAPGTLPRPFVEAVAGALRGIVTGPYGYPVTHVRASLVGAEMRAEEAHEAAFEEAAVRAFHQGLAEGGVLILEPVMRLEVRCPVEYLGELIRDLNARRAVIEESHPDRTPALVRARAPLARLFGYATTLRSLTQGRASYTMEPAAFQPVPEEEQARRVF